MPLTERPDGTVQHTGSSACGRVWHARAGKTALERALHCPDLNDEMLTRVVAQQEATTRGLAALAGSYQGALEASVADRSTLRANVTALTEQVASLTATQVALTKRVADLAARTPVLAYKAQSVPAITVGQTSADVTITWDAPFPDANYTVVPPSVTTTGVTLLGKVGASLKSKTATGVVVTVTTSALLTAGAAQVHVLAYRVGG